MTRRTQKKVSLGRRIAGIIALVVYFVFCVWASWWFLIFIPLVYDYFFSQKIPWGWYKKLESRFWRTFFSWVDCIVFALLGVYIVFLFFFQNFVIPTSSLEKTLLVGDYVFVSKLAYGPRMPITPIYFPLAHNTIFGHQSYLDSPKLKYHRLKGFGHVKEGDIVVFNFPAGDTVATAQSNVDFYTLCDRYGRVYVMNHPEQFGKIVTRPVDKRDYYVKRCVGLPGQTLQINDNKVYINGKLEPLPRHAEFNYIIQTDGTMFNSDFIEKLGISNEDNYSWQGNAEVVNDLGLQSVGPNNYGVIYHWPLSADMLKKVKAEPYVRKVVIEKSTETKGIYPLNYPTGWTRDNYGPILIPKKGMKVELTPLNIALYERPIKAYEGHRFEVKNGVCYIDGKPSKTYTFGMDYYFMMGDNRHNSADSRYWGFVPEDHIVGSPVFVSISLNKDRGWFDGKVRWDRLFHSVRSLDKGD